MLDLTLLFQHKMSAMYKFNFPGSFTYQGGILTVTSMYPPEITQLEDWPVRPPTHTLNIYWMFGNFPSDFKSLSKEEIIECLPNYWEQIQNSIKHASYDKMDIMTEINNVKMLFDFINPKISHSKLTYTNALTIPSSKIRSTLQKYFGYT